jgi:hypothetical protein
MKKIAMKILRAYSWCILKMVVWLSYMTKPILNWMLRLSGLPLNTTLENWRHQELHDELQKLWPTRFNSLLDDDVLELQSVRTITDKIGNAKSFNNDIRNKTDVNEYTLYKSAEKLSEIINNYEELTNESGWLNDKVSPTDVIYNSAYDQKLPGDTLIKKKTKSKSTKKKTLEKSKSKVIKNKAAKQKKGSKRK